MVLNNMFLTHILCPDYSKILLFGRERLNGVPKRDSAFLRRMCELLAGGLEWGPY
jgi:hypothetical protein